MDRTRLMCVQIITLFLFFAIVFSVYYSMQLNMPKNETNGYTGIPLEEYEPNIGIEGFDSENYIVDESFVTHLPLVIIETKDEIPNAYTYNKKEERFVLRDGIDPYVHGRIEVINNTDHVNRLGDAPEVSSEANIKYRGNSSIVYDKHQYRIKLVDDAGNSNPQNILNMGEDNDWILNISMIDESLVRNYMVYTICSKFMRYVPDIKFCEVVKKTAQGYEYEGLYLMMEVVEQGKDRVDISAFSKKNSFNSYIVRRDRYDDEGIMLDTYATRNELCYGYLDLRYPKRQDLTEEVIRYITDDISKVEIALFSEDEDSFNQYSEYIDEDSFVDYFLVNEFFTNYDAGNNSTYMYKDVRGKLCIGPVWDYDNAADNQGQYLLDPERISFEGQSWYPQLLQSETFCKKLEKRYAELRDSYFSDEYVNNFIDETVTFLGNAQKRDWSRWNYKYSEERFDLIKDSKGVVIDRNYDEYTEVVQRLKDVLNEHAYYIPERLRELTYECRYKAAYRSHYGYFILLIIAFLSAVVIGRR